MEGREEEEPPQIVVEDSNVIQLMNQMTRKKMIHLILKIPMMVEMMIMILKMTIHHHHSSVGHHLQVAEVDHLAVLHQTVGQVLDMMIMMTMNMMMIIHHLLHVVVVVVADVAGHHLVTVEEEVRHPVEAMKVGLYPMDNEDVVVLPHPVHSLVVYRQFVIECLIPTQLRIPCYQQHRQQRNVRHNYPPTFTVR